MLSYLIPVLIAIGGQTPAPTAGSLVSKMFERYAYAKKLGGTIRTSQVAGSTVLVTDTSIAYERPSKLHLEQRRKTSEGVKEKILVSDGRTFRYTPPERIITATPFLREPVQPPNRAAQTVSDLYLVVAGDLPDRSPALDAAIGREDDLQYFKNQLATFKLDGREKVGDREANVIVGAWRESDTTPVSGSYRMLITDEGDLVRYVLLLNMQVPVDPNQPQGVKQTIGITTTWDVALTVDPTLKPDAFNVG